MEFRLLWATTGIRIRYLPCEKIRCLFDRNRCEKIDSARDADHTLNGKSKSPKHSLVRLNACESIFTWRARYFRMRFRSKVNCAHKWMIKTISLYFFSVIFKSRITINVSAFCRHIKCPVIRNDTKRRENRRFELLFVGFFFHFFFRFLRQCRDGHSFNSHAYRNNNDIPSQIIYLCVEIRE